MIIEQFVRFIAGDYVLRFLTGLVHGLYNNPVRTTIFMITLGAASVPPAAVRYHNSVKNFSKLPLEIRARIRAADAR